MARNYNKNFRVTVTEWDNNADDSDLEPDKVRECTLEELYYDRHRGDLVLSFNDDEAEQFFDVSVPIKPVSEWNSFVDSLPEWDL